MKKQNAKPQRRKDAKIDTWHQAWTQRFAHAREPKGISLRPCVFAFCCSATARQLRFGNTGDCSPQ